MVLLSKKNRLNQNQIIMIVFSSVKKKLAKSMAHWSDLPSAAQGESENMHQRGRAPP